MNTFFDEQQLSISNKDGETLEFFMRPLKIKELKVIRRISFLAESGGAEEFTTPLLLTLMIGCFSIDSRYIPRESAEKLINTFIDYNFPKVKEFEESDRSATKKKQEKKISKPLSFYIDFLVNQGYSFHDVMEMTLPQFNELIIKAGERLCPSSKVMDPLEAFTKMGIPIRNRGNNGR